jgi:hypothetical protein
MIKCLQPDKLSVSLRKPQKEDTPMDLHSGCFDAQALPPAIDRQPAYAGSFYPSDPKKLRESLEQHFAQAQTRPIPGLQAIIAPHAGFVFSGDVAAEAYAAIDPETEWDNVIILGASHRHHFPGASIYHQGHYQTPLGKVKVNRSLAKQLTDSYPVFQFPPEAHLQEHSLEVQLPFLQYHLPKSPAILPILLGTTDAEECAAIAEALHSLFTPRNLFIISSDFSHYPPFETAIVEDAQTARSIVQNNPVLFLKHLASQPVKPVRGLSTRACGWTAILSLLYMSRRMISSRYTLLRYENSGHKKQGDKSEVVGYYAIGLLNEEAAENTLSSRFSKEEQDILGMIARHSIEVYLEEDRKWEIGEEAVPERLCEKSGAFVSLKIGKKLRGCLGRFSSDAPLFKLVQDMAIAAATKDPRFRPITLRELEEVRIEISVLSPLKRVQSLDEVIMGRHGIYLKKGFHSGTYLPQVARETGWTAEEFLGHCARDKAEIGWDGWKEAEMYVYEVEEIQA